MIDHPVLIVEDDTSWQEVKRWFNADPQRPDGERLVFHSLCENDQELYDELIQSEDCLPEVVLLDDVLQNRASLSSERKAFAMVCWIAERFGERRPKCILTTGRLTPNYCYAFCELGGHNVIDKARPHERLPIIWETLQGRLWEPVVTSPEAPVSFSVLDTNGQLLPYLEFPHWSRLAETDLGLTPATVAKRKSRLADLLGMPGSSDRTELVHEANSRGLVWVPLTYRHLLPSAHPEYRSQRFVPPAGARS